MATNTDSTQYLGTIQLGNGGWIQGTGTVTIAPSAPSAGGSTDAYFYYKSSGTQVVPAPPVYATPVFTQPVFTQLAELDEWNEFQAWKREKTQRLVAETERLLASRGDDRQISFED